MAYQAPPPYADKPPPYPGGHTIVYPTAGTSETKVVVQPQPTAVVHSSSTGFMSTLNLIGRAITDAIDTTANEINKFTDANWTCPLLSMFSTQNEIQLVSRSTGNTLQIVSNKYGQLVVDGLGRDGQAAYNAVWTVINEGNNQVRLHNNNNYLAIVNADTVVMHAPPGVPPGVETKFQLYVMGQFVTLESMKSRNHHVGVLPNGQLKSAMATGKELHAHFGVRMIYSPYSQPK